jgi:hypothetical protein
MRTLLIPCLLACTALAFSSSTPVLDEQGALKLARPALVAKFGESHVSKFDPYHAEHKGKTWLVYGSLPKGLTRGGTPEASISASTGRVIKVSHGR